MTTMSGASSVITITPKVIAGISSAVALVLLLLGPLYYAAFFRDSSGARQPVVPKAPVLPETPVVTKAPVLPETPVVTKAPVLPETPVVPGTSVSSDGEIFVTGPEFDKVLVQISGEAHDLGLARGKAQARPAFTPTDEVLLRARKSLVPFRDEVGPSVREGE